MEKGSRLSSDKRQIAETRWRNVNPEYVDYTHPFIQSLRQTARDYEDAIYLETLSGVLGQEVKTLAEASQLDQFRTRSRLDIYVQARDRLIVDFPHLAIRELLEDYPDYLPRIAAYYDVFVFPEYTAQAALDTADFEQSVLENLQQL